MKKRTGENWRTKRGWHGLDESLATEDVYNVNDDEGVDEVEGEHEEDVIWRARVR
jgi:hypothetical protein